MLNKPAYLALLYVLVSTSTKHESLILRFYSQLMLFKFL